MKTEQELRDEILEEMLRNQKEEKVERYRRLNKSVKPGQILFVGSSLMEQFPVNELLLDLDEHITVYNRGSGGFTTAELMEVLDACVYDVKPRYIFINIGTNDLNGPDYQLSGLLERYEEILRRIREHLPEAKITMMAYYPVNAKVETNPHMEEIFVWRTNERIREANAAVKELAAKMGCAFLDVNEPVTDEEGDLKAEYTIEGMHFYGDGYLGILKKMLPVLRECADSL